MSEAFPRIQIRRLFDLMDKLCPTKRIDMKRLAQSLGYQSTAGLGSHLSTGRALDIFEIEDDEVVLTKKGEAFCRSEHDKSRIIQDYLMDKDNGLGLLTETIRQKGSQISLEDIESCIQLFVDKPQDAKTLVNTVVDWYAHIGLLYLRGKEVHSMLPSVSLVLNLSSMISKEGLDFKIYMDLTSADFASEHSTDSLSFKKLERIYNDIESASEQTTEKTMKEFVSGVFRNLGFSTMHATGTRTAETPRFGSSGDDLLVAFPITTHPKTGDVEGLAFACELKRSNPNKKAVGQAVTFMNEVRNSYPDLQTFPIVISGSNRYVDETAERYAASSLVILISLDFLFGVLKEQKERYETSNELLTVLDFAEMFFELQARRIIEPRLEDLINWIKRK